MPKAARAAEDLLGKYVGKVENVTLQPSSGGVFEVTVGDKLIFSKKELERFPEEGEVINLAAPILDK